MPSADSPLNAVGVEAKVGERIVAVERPAGVARAAAASAARPSGRARRSSCTLAAADGARATRTVVVSPRSPTKCRRATANGSSSNRAWVHEQSDGRVGYFHLPDMMSAGFAEFHRYFSAECDRDALIVDVRYNRGGHVSQLLLEKVARKRIGYDLARWGEPTPYPDESRRRAGRRADQRARRLRRRHLLALLQADGDRHAGRHAHLGRRRSASGRGTRSSTAPRRRSRSSRSGSATSAGASRTTAPIRDIEVDNAPQDAAAGRDRQLEVALQTALAEPDAAPQRDRCRSGPCSRSAAAALNSLRRQADQDGGRTAPLMSPAPAPDLHAGRARSLRTANRRGERHCT